MVRCPACESVRIVVVVSPERRAFCARCGVRWVQDGDRQRAIRRPAEASSEAPKTA